MGPEPRDLLKAYQERLRDLRRTSGVAGPLLAPLQLQAELIESALRRQAEFEQRMTGVVDQLGSLVELARDAPATLRTQAKAFDAAAAALKQVADVLDLQADLLERTAGVLGAPGTLLRAVRDREAPPPEPQPDVEAR